MIGANVIVLVRGSIVVIKHQDLSNSLRKRFGRLIFPCHNPSLKKDRTGSQTVQEPGSIKSLAYGPILWKHFPK